MGVWPGLGGWASRPGSGILVPDLRSQGSQSLTRESGDGDRDGGGWGLATLPAERPDNARCPSEPPNKKT